MFASISSNKKPVTLAVLMLAALAPDRLKAEMRIVTPPGQAAEHSAQASASGIPHYDPDAHCRQVASVGVGSSAIILNSCLEMEQHAYDSLKARWQSLPDPMRQHCDEVASVGGHGSYTILESCVEMELEATAKQRGFRF